MKRDMEKNGFPGKTRCCIQYLTARNVSPLAENNRTPLSFYSVVYYLLILFLRLFLNFRCTCSGFKNVCILKLYKNKMNNNNKDIIYKVGFNIT